MNKQKDSHTLRSKFFIPSRLLQSVVWGYAVLVLAACGVLYLLGDRWWPATILLFGPRWLAALPLAVLVPFAFRLDRRLLVPLLFAALIVFGPFMGLCVPHGKTGTASSSTIRVVACNIQGGNFNKSAFSALIQETRPDIIALQECPREIGNLLPTGWQLVQEGGLAILSRYPLTYGGKLQSMHPPHKWPRDCLLYGTVKLPAGDITVATVHLPSPRYGLQHILDRRTGINLARTGLLVKETDHRAETARKVQQAVPSGGNVLVLGDFNTPSESTIYRRTWDRYVNAFGKTGAGYGYTERVSIGGVSFGVRIDHVLTGAGLVPRVCEVGPDVGSDHLPVIADLAVKR